MHLQLRTNSGQDRKVPTLILDQKGKSEEEEEEEEEEFIVQDQIPLGPSSETLSESQSKPEGALTKTLMAAKERFGGDEGKGGGPRSVTITEAQRKRERELIEKEVSKLQSSIQSLSQTANPLGKIMDYVQVKNLRILVIKIIVLFNRKTLIVWNKSWKCGRRKTLNMLKL